MKEESGGFCGCVVAFLLVNVLLGGICTQYCVEFWASYLKEVPVDVPFWVCAIGGLFLGEVTVPAAIFTWILSFVL